MKEINQRERFLLTLNEIIDQIKLNSGVIDIQNILNLIELILNIKENDQMVFIYGAGRSGFVGRCFAQRLMHLGINSCYISDAITHQYTKNDLVIIISGSGETTSSVAIAQKANLIGGKIALFTGNPESTIGKISNCVIEIKGKSKDMAISKKTLAPFNGYFRSDRTRY
jgi:6-phospho-3-hexuloisomerase